jgi:outer membrane protein assembly factor BamE (lipoprotein component of BamABCDE complex)
VRRGTRSLFIVAALILSGLALSSCVIVPIPAPIPGVPAKQFNRNISEQTMAALIPGKTNRKDILLLLGEPDYASDDERTFVYEAEKSGGATDLYVIGCILLPGGCGIDAIEGTPQSDGCRLTIRFDSEGLLKDSIFKSFINEARAR